MSDETKNDQGPAAGLKNENAEDGTARELPVTILSQYVRDLSFENPQAIDFMQSGKGLPEMDINIGMDARKVPDEKMDNLYEVVLNVRAEAKHEEDTVFIAELLYGVAVVIGEEVPEENHHPLLLIEIPRMAFPFARQILSTLTVQGGYPPLLLTPVDFHALYMQRFGDEIEKARKEFEQDLREDIEKGKGKDKNKAGKAKKKEKQK